MCAKAIKMRDNKVLICKVPRDRVCPFRSGLFLKFPKLNIKKYLPGLSGLVSYNNYQIKLQLHIQRVHLNVLLIYRTL